VSKNKVARLLPGEFEFTRRELAHCSLTESAKFFVCLFMYNMKPAYRMYLREKRVYYVQNNSTGGRESLRTKDEQEAKRLLEVHNSAGKATALNLQIGRPYLRRQTPRPQAAHGRRRT
jgi:hypothetical protein